MTQEIKCIWGRHDPRDVIPCVWVMSCAAESEISGVGEAKELLVAVSRSVDQVWLSKEDSTFKCLEDSGSKKWLEWLCRK